MNKIPVSMLSPVASQVDDFCSVCPRNSYRQFNFGVRTREKNEC